MIENEKRNKKKEQFWKSKVEDLLKEKRRQLIAIQEINKQVIKLEQDHQNIKIEVKEKSRENKELREQL